MSRFGVLSPRTTKTAALPPLAELEHAPLATRARDAILQAILRGRFDDGRLPPEEELAVMLNVSRTTIRAAVQDLERDGLITRRRAVGTIINRHVGVETLALQRLVGFDQLLEEKGHDVEVKSSWQRRAAPEVADLVPWDGDEECCVLDKHYFADGRLAIALRDYVPWDELTVEKLPTTVEPSLFEFSRQYGRHPIAHAVVRIVPAVNRGKGATQLDLPRGAPFLRLHETHHATNAKPVAWTFIDLDDRVLRLEVFRGQS